MSSLDSLPQDQRAVLQLVLSRGRSYDQIAQLLKINRDSVRERALAALNALGPETSAAAENRGKIADYLLGQLADETAVDEVRHRLATSPSDRAWARVVSSELAPLASEGLPEIPTEAEPAPPVAVAPAATPARAPAAATPTAAPGAIPSAAPGAPGEPQEHGDGASERRPRSSRVGGIILLVAAAIIAVAVVLFFVLRSNGGSPHPAAAASSTTSTTSSAATASSTTSASSTTQAKVVAQINLTPPHTGSKTAGIAEVLDEGTSQGVAIVAQNVPPNTTKPPNAYAVWLYNSPKDAQILGFVNPGVGANGRLSTAGALPSNAKRYKELIVTIETNAKPQEPGTILLQGTLTGL